MLASFNFNIDRTSRLGQALNLFRAANETHVFALAQKSIRQSGLLNNGTQNTCLRGLYFLEHARLPLLVLHQDEMQSEITQQRHLNETALLDSTTAQQNEITANQHQLVESVFNSLLLSACKTCEQLSAPEMMLWVVYISCRALLKLAEKLQLHNAQKSLTHILRNIVKRMPFIDAHLPNQNQLSTLLDSEHFKSYFTKLSLLLRQLFEQLKHHQQHLQHSILQRSIGFVFIEQQDATPNPIA
jgi:hypothetical protein